MSFYSFDRCTNQLKKMKEQKFGLCGPNKKLMPATFCPRRAVYCACPLYGLKLVGTRLSCYFTVFTRYKIINTMVRKVKQNMRALG